MTVDPMLIDADDQHQAPKAPLRSPDFRRMVRLAWPHRRFIALGLVASILYAFLHSVSIIGVLPVLKVMLSEEGLHGWIQQSIAQERLGLELAVREDAGAGAAPAGATAVVIVEIPADSPLRDRGVAPFDVISNYRIVVDTQARATKASEGAADLRRATPEEFFEDVATADPRAKIIFTTRGAGTLTVSTGPHTLTLERPSAGKRLLGAAGRLVPRARQREDRLTTLVWVLGAVVVIALLSNVARFVSQYYVAVGVLRAVMDLRRVLYRKVLRLPMDFFSQNVADVVSRFVQDAAEIQRGMMSIFGKMLREPIKALFLLGWALTLDARMTVTMLLVGPVAALIFWAVGRKIRKANKRLLQAYGTMIGALSTTFHAIGVVKAYNAENTERRHLWRIDRKMFGHQLRIAKLEATMRPMLEVLGVVGIAAVTVWQGKGVISREIKLEDFATLVVVLGMLIDPLRKVADVYPRVMRAAAGARRVFSIVDAPEEDELLQGAAELPPLAEKIELKDVTFTYPEAEVPALKNVSVSIHKGETVAIVGPNGSGKTTLAKLMIRFHDPQSGAVLFDGVDIRQARLPSLRRQFSVVSQDPVVFAMTVAENIAYGSRDGSTEAIAEAARRARADEFIRAKPGGYDELIGERGVTLSGGQRQRICIARAMMRNAPVLIFDEATSQIDSESEQQIQDAVREYAAGRTTILIAHRLSTIRFAGRVIVMNEGKIIDSGTHMELVARCSLYATLCKTQLDA